MGFKMSEVARWTRQCAICKKVELEKHNPDVDVVCPECGWVWTGYAPSVGHETGVAPEPYGKGDHY